MPNQPTAAYVNLFLGRFKVEETPKRPTAVPTVKAKRPQKETVGPKVQKKKQEQP